MAQQIVIAGFTLLLPIDEEAPAPRSRPPRLDTFDGKVVGFLNNTKDNVDLLFAAMQRHLETAYTPRAIVHRAKTHFAVRAPQELLETLHQQCDAVIVAAGA